MPGTLPTDRVSKKWPVPLIDRNGDKTHLNLGTPCVQKSQWAGAWLQNMELGRNWRNIILLLCEYFFVLFQRIAYWLKHKYVHFVNIFIFLLPLSLFNPHSSPSPSIFSSLPFCLYIYIISMYVHMYTSFYIYSPYFLCITLLREEVRSWRATNR